MKKNGIIVLLLLILGFHFNCVQARERGRHVLTPKLGTFSLNNSTQSSGRVFDTQSDSVLGFEYAWHLDTGFSIGGDFLHYENTFTTFTSFEAKTNVFLFNTKYHFNRDSPWQPFIGVGVGIALTDSTGEFFIGNHSGPAYQLVAGLTYRFKYVGVYAEYKWLHSKVEDTYLGSTISEIDLSGHGVQLGISILL